MGDPSGIGPEIIVKALKCPEIKALADYIVIADSWVLKKSQKSPLQAGPPPEEKVKSQKFKVIDLNNVPRKRFEFGKVKAEYGKASMEYLAKAMELIKKKEIDCLVTAPICKESINLAGYRFSGHTEYIAAVSGNKDVVMFLANSMLKVSLVTRHIPLKDVARSLNISGVYKTIMTTAAELRALFNIKNPRLAVCGLNPHASDNGLIGDEEKKIIIPAIKRSRKQGVLALGPFPSDTLFQKAIKGDYDAVICMYHDQGLIPLKIAGFNQAVNITLGLPFVRTSPAHGTGFDIAAKGIADPNSFIEAVKLAVKCSQNLKKA